MNDGAPSPRLAGLTGLVLAGTVAVWWLGSTRLALDNASDASRPAVAALEALCLLRAMVLALTTLRVATLHGWRPAAAQAVVLCAIAWPLVTLVWAASTSTIARVAGGEGLLLAGGIGLALVGQCLRRAVPRADIALPIATVAGTALAAALWFTREAWVLASSG